MHDSFRKLSSLSSDWNMSGFRATPYGTISSKGSVLRRERKQSAQAVRDRGEFAYLPEPGVVAKRQHKELLSKKGQLYALNHDPPSRTVNSVTE